MKTCEICGWDKNIVNHHLSYEPEILVEVCQKCHMLSHRMAVYSNEQLDLIIKLVKEYRGQWINATQKFNKSEYKKNKTKEYTKEDYWKERRQTNEYKEYQQNYKAMQKLNKLNPERIEKLLRRMENQVEMMEKIKCQK